MNASMKVLHSSVATVMAIAMWSLPAPVSAEFPLTGAGFAPEAPASIFTQLAYSDEDGMLVVYHVLKPGPFFTSDKTGTVYRFKDDATQKGCPRLRPVFREGEVLRDDTPAFAQLGEGLSEADRARRSITDVFFKSGCPKKQDQPRSEAEILALEDNGEVELIPEVDIVNAPTVPSPKARADRDLWEGAPDGVNIFTEIFPAEDPRHGGQIRSSADFAALDGMNGFTMASALWAGKLKIVNCPIFASDLNRDRAFSTEEMIAFPNHVLAADQNGNFTLSSSLNEPIIGE